MRLRIGIDLGGTKTEAIGLDGSREVTRIRTATPHGDYAATIDTVASLVSGIEDAAGVPGSVGIGIPGALAPDTGLVKNANSTWLIGRPLLADLESRLRRPVRVANDANCFAMSEAADGAGAGARVVFGVIVGTGTGAGLVVSGHVLTGPNAIAGEWGHNPLPWPQTGEWPGPRCYCGKTGCVETFLSGPGMARDYREITGQAVAPAEIARRAQAGDASAESVLARYEDRMARALAAVINVVDPDVVVLGGGMSNIDRLYGGVLRRLGGYVFGATAPPVGPRDGPLVDADAAAGRPAAEGAPQVRTRLFRAAHGDSSGVRGAAWLWPG